MSSIKTNRNRRGEIISYRFRACVGRDEVTGKQIWRTVTYPKPEGLTPKAERRAIERAADEWERQQRDDYRKGLEPDRDRVTLAGFIRGHWWPNSVEAAGYAPNTLISYTKLTRGVLEHFGERIRLIEIDPERVGAFVRWLKADRGLSERTTRMHFNLLRGVLSYAVACGYLESNPIERMRQQDKPTVTIKEPDFMSVEEIKAFLNALESDGDMPELWKAYFQLLIFAGVRRGEGLALTWADYDAERRELTISKSVTLTGESGAETAVKDTKTGKKRRVPVCDTLAAALEARRLEMLSQYGECNPAWFIFGAVENPEKTVSPNLAYGHLSRFQKKHGLRRTSVHLLRHSFASLCLEGGGNLKQLQAVLGHSRAQTTLTYYAGIAEHQSRAAVESVERLINNGGNDK